jgi:hypothetical protein
MDILSKIEMSVDIYGHSVTVYSARRYSLVSIKKVDKTDKKMDTFAL